MALSHLSLNKYRSELSLPLFATAPFAALWKKCLVLFYWRSFYFVKPNLEMFFWKTFLEKERDLKKIVIEQLWHRKSYFTLYAHINETQTTKTPIEVHLAPWVDCDRFNNSPLSVQVCAVCAVLNTSRKWLSNKRSKHFYTAFNARVNWIRSATGVGDKLGNQSLPQNFHALF